MNKDTYLEKLKSNGLSNTKSRHTVFSALKSIDSPTSMNDLIKRCSSIDRVSVYRAIETFEKIGIASKVHIGWKYKIELSDDFKHHHHHLTCSVCGSVTDFDEPNQLLQELKKISTHNNFKIQSHTLEISGLCKSCM